MSEEEQVPLPVKRLIETWRSFLTEESATNALSFNPGSQDVILSTALKSGTTVTQQVWIILDVAKSIMISLV